MTSGRVIEAHRAFQSHTLDALSSSMALRYDGSNVGVVLLLHCFYAASFPSHGRKPGVQCTVVVAHRLTHPGIDEEGPHEPTRRHWEMAMGKISAFTLPSCAASFTCSLFTCRPPLPLGLHWACSTNSRFHTLKGCLTRRWAQRLELSTPGAAEGPKHAAGCRHGSWLPPYRVGREVSSGRAWARGVVGAHWGIQGKGAALSTSAAARDTALRAAKPPRLRRGHHQKGKDKEGGVFAW